MSFPSLFIYLSTRANRVVFRGIIFSYFSILRGGGHLYIYTQLPETTFYYPFPSAGLIFCSNKDLSDLIKLWPDQLSTLQKVYAPSLSFSFFSFLSFLISLSFSVCLCLCWVLYFKAIMFKPLHNTQIGRRTLFNGHLSKVGN